jgi:hypothetical protein
MFCQARQPEGVLGQYGLHWVSHSDVIVSRFGNRGFEDVKGIGWKFCFRWHQEHQIMRSVCKYDMIIHYLTMIYIYIAVMCLFQQAPSWWCFPGPRETVLVFVETVLRSQQSKWFLESTWINMNQQLRTFAHFRMSPYEWQRLIFLADWDG